jgi:hypothetical protein
MSGDAVQAARTVVEGWGKGAAGEQATSAASGMGNGPACECVLAKRLGFYIETLGRARAEYVGVCGRSKSSASDGKRPPHASGGAHRNPSAWGAQASRGWVGCRGEGAGTAPSWAAYEVGGARHGSQWAAGMGFEQRGGIRLETAAVGREHGGTWATRCVAGA